MVGTQHFNLRWNNHTSNILQVFLEHLSSESLVDVTLSSEGKFIKAHKIILSACSPYFQEVFAKYTDKQPLIILNGIRFEDLQSMIKFMYNGEIRVQETELEALLAAAETLQVKGLSNVRTKYERGEITSVTSVAQKSPSNISESPVLSKESSPVDSIKAKDALIAPTTAIIRPPNCVLPAASIVTPPSAVGVCPKSVSGNFARRSSSNVSKSSGKTINIAPRPPNAPVPALAIATILPAATSKMIPAASTASSVRAVVPILPRPATSSSSMNSKIGKSGKSGTYGKFRRRRAANTTTMSSSVIPITFATSLIEPTTIGSSHSTVKSTVTLSNVSTDTTNGETNFLQYQNDCNPITEISRVSIDPTPPSGTIGTIDDGTGKKPEAQAPRVRKRRKMSHTVNELARETVFTINGRVLLDTDLAASETGNKNSIAVRTDLSDSGTIEGITPRKLRVQIQSKHPQESLLIKDKEKEPTKIPRPLNAFMIFANEWRRKLAAENPTESNTTISVRLGKMWKSLSVDSKETYYRRAQIADEIHYEKYPGYYYSPREARLRKNLKQEKTATKCSSTSSKPTPESQNLDELTMIKAYVNGEKRTNDEEISTFESDGKYSDDEDDYKEEQEDYYDDEEDDDVILEYSADEDEPEEKPDLTVLAGI